MGYLDQYGVAEARRERLVKRALLTLLIVVVVGGSLYLWFKNYREERRVKEFLAALAAGDYAAAYSFWGCKVESPCPHYDYKSFLEDWGPSSKVGKVQSYKLGVSHQRGSGVEIPVSINGIAPIKLWVEKKDEMIGFAPPF